MRWLVTTTRASIGSAADLQGQDQAWVFYGSPMLLCDSHPWHFHSAPHIHVSDLGQLISVPRCCECFSFLAVCELIFSLWERTPEESHLRKEVFPFHGLRVQCNLAARAALNSSKEEYLSLPWLPQTSWRDTDVMLCSLAPSSCLNGCQAVTLFYVGKYFL